MARRSVSRGSTTVEGTSTNRARRTARAGPDGWRQPAAGPGGGGPGGQRSRRHHGDRAMHLVQHGEGDAAEDERGEAAATAGPDDQQVRIVGLFGQHLGGAAVGRHRQRPARSGAARAPPSVAGRASCGSAPRRPATAARDRSRCRTGPRPSRSPPARNRRSVRRGRPRTRRRHRWSTRRLRPRPRRCVRRAGRGPPPAGSRCARPAAVRWNRPAPRATHRDRGCR